MNRARHGLTGLLLASGAVLAAAPATDLETRLQQMDRQVEQQQRQRQARMDRETAAEMRAVAVLALDALARGRIDHASVIQRYEAVTRLDPGVVSDWLVLTRLYRAAGQLAQAQQAARQAAAIALDEADRRAAAAALEAAQTPVPIQE